MKTIKPKKKLIDLTIKKDADTIKPKKKLIGDNKLKFNYKSSKFWEDVYDDDEDLSLITSEEE
jgi:hypothetical protein